MIDAEKIAKLPPHKRLKPIAIEMSHYVFVGICGVAIGRIMIAVEIIIRGCHF